MMEPDRLLLIFERSPEESGLTGVRDAIQALGLNDIDVRVVSQNPGGAGLIGGMLRFWFPYLWNEGITGVAPGAAEVGEFIITLAPRLDQVFGAVLAAWLQAQYGRKIRVKFDDLEIEAQTGAQVETLLARLEAVRQSRKAAQRDGL